jgi:hypothetical protein
MASAFGGHACAKTVSALTLYYAWLKSSFHCSIPKRIAAKPLAFASIKKGALFYVNDAPNSMQQTCLLLQASYEVNVGRVAVL